MEDHEVIPQIEYDDITMNTKNSLTLFGSTFGTLRSDGKSCFNTFFGFTPYWDNKPTKAIHSDSPGVHTTDKILILYTINKIHLK